MKTSDQKAVLKFELKALRSLRISSSAGIVMAAKQREDVISREIARLSKKCSQKKHLKPNIKIDM
ncbi:MAG: hypothetical protein LBV12_12720 [Puniceicoccales bacterium]|jgi:hypothetical protein|nr:hypothetical protein [Puniceicoccales bacterium]